LSRAPASARAPEGTRAALTVESTSTLLLRNPY
jgi:hypothetical protein